MKLCVIIYFALLAIRKVQADVSHLHKNQYLPPNQNQYNNSDDTVLVTDQSRAQENEQEPSKSFLFGNVEITRSIPIASFTITNTVPVEQNRDSNSAATPVQAQAPTTKTQSGEGSYNYPTPIGSLQAPNSQATSRSAAQPTARQATGTYTTDAQVSIRVPTYSGNLEQPNQKQQFNIIQQANSAVINPAQQLIAHQQFAALAPAPTQAAPAAVIPSPNVQQSRYNAASGFTPTQTQAQISLASYNYSGPKISFQAAQSQIAPLLANEPTEKQNVGSNDFDVPATATRPSYPTNLQQASYAPQTYSGSASQQVVPTEQSLIPAPVPVAIPSPSTPIQQTYSTPDQALSAPSYPVPRQESAAAHIQQINSTPDQAFSAPSYPVPRQESAAISSAPSKKYLPPAASGQQVTSPAPPAASGQQVTSFVPVDQPSYLAPPSVPNEQNKAARPESVSVESTPTTFSQIYAPAFPPQAFIEYRPSVQQNQNDKASTQVIKVSQVHAYLPPTTQPQETKEKEQYQHSVPVPSQPAQHYSADYQQQRTSAFQPAPLPETLPQQQTYKAPQVLNANSYAEPTPPKQMYANPAQESYSVSVPIQSQQTYLAPPQQSYYPSTTSIEQSQESVTPEYIPPVARQSNMAPALVTSQQSQFSAETNQAYIPPLQTYSSPPSNVGSPSPSASHTYLPPTLNQVSVNQQIPTSSLAPVEVGQAPLPPAPAKDTYFPSPQAQLSQQSYAASVMAASPASTGTPPQRFNTAIVSATTPRPSFAQQESSIPAQPSRVYLPPAFTASYAGAYVPSYAAPALAASSVSHFNPNTQSSSINRQYFPPAPAQQRYSITTNAAAPTPAIVTVLGPQTRNSGSVPLAQTIFHSSTAYHSRNNQQNQLPKYESYASASRAFQFPAPIVTSQANSQTGTIYGSNGGYVY